MFVIAYILLSIILWGLVLLVARKDQLTQYLPAMLYASFSSLALDVYFAWNLNAYAYSTFYAEPLASLITGVFICPGFALLFVHYLPTQKTLITYYTLAWVGLLDLTEYIFLRIDEIIFYTWHLGYSTLAYLISLSIIIYLAHLYSEDRIYKHSNF